MANVEHNTMDNGNLHKFAICQDADPTTTGVARGGWVDTNNSNLFQIRDAADSAWEQLTVGGINAQQDLDLNDYNIDNCGAIYMKEQAAAEADVASYGQLWVKTVTPNELWFTDDAGTDTQLGTGGGGSPGGANTQVQVNIDSAFGGSASFIADVDAIRTSGANPYFGLTAPADTGQTASTESVGMDLDLSATRQWATGALTEQNEIKIQSPTYAFVGASTLTETSTMKIVNVPQEGTNATITTTIGLQVEDTNTQNTTNKYGVYAWLDQVTTSAVTRPIFGLLNDVRVNTNTSAGVWGEARRSSATGSGFGIGTAGYGYSNTANTEMCGVYGHVKTENSTTTKAFGVVGSVYRNADSGTAWRVGVAGSVRQGADFSCGVWGSVGAGNVSPSTILADIDTIVATGNHAMFAFCDTATQIGIGIEGASAQTGNLIEATANGGTQGELFALSATASIFLGEKAAADGDTAGMGQLWVKNTTPCQLWFTDDAGTDTQIV